jgi:hypothetical protein
MTSGRTCGRTCRRRVPYFLSPAPPVDEVVDAGALDADDDDPDADEDVDDGPDEEPEEEEDVEEDDESPPPLLWA